MKKYLLVTAIIILAVLASCASSNVIKLSKTVFTWEGHTYMVIKKTVTWNQAKEKCEEAGGYLVVINDRPEDRFISSICKHIAWIGLSDTEKEGQFVWVDGTPMNYKNFRDGEPNDHGKGEDYVHKLVEGNWNDSNLSPYDPYDSLYNTYYFICEFNRIIENEEAKQLLVELYKDPVDPDTLVLNRTETEKTAEFTDSGTAVKSEPEDTSVPLSETPAAATTKGEIGIITVMDLKVENMPESEGRLVSDLLGSTFISITNLRVIGREQRDQILAEMEFSMSGCADEACQLEIGRLLAADGIVVGSIGNVGNRYILNIKLIDVETSEAISTSYKIYKSLDKLVDGCEDVVRSLKYK